MKRYLDILLIVSIVILIVFFGLFKVVNFDFGWHLKAGEYIFTNKNIPAKDIFSYIAAGNKWVDSHWLFQLIIYSFYLISGINGIIAFRIIILLATFLLIFFTIYRKEYTAISIAVMVIALYISFQRFLMRPEVLSLLFLAIFFYFTENLPRHKRLSIIIIFITQIIWVNTHGLYILGIVFLLLTVSGDTVQVLNHKFFPCIPAAGIDESVLKQKTILLFFCVGAVLFNANGRDGILYPFKIFYELRKKPFIFSQIVELIPPFSPQMKNLPFHNPIYIYKIFLMFSIITIVLGIILQYRQIRLSRLFLFGAFIYLYILGMRNIPLFAKITALILTIVLGMILEYRQIRLSHLFLFGAFIYLYILGMRNIPLFAKITALILIIVLGIILEYRQIRLSYLFLFGAFIYLYILILGMRYIPLFTIITALILIIVLGIILQYRQIRLSYLFLFGAFIYLSILGVRNIPLFAIITAPILIKSLYGITDFLLKTKIKQYIVYLRLPIIINTILIIFIISLCTLVANNKLYQSLQYLRTFGFGESDYYPKQAVEYLKSGHIKGNIFNSSEIGGYLIWKIYPEKKVALDGRWEVYENFISNIQYLQNPNYFSRLAARFNIKTIILHKRSLELRLMGTWLNRNPLWLLTEDTPVAVIYEKRY